MRTRESKDALAWWITCAFLSVACSGVWVLFGEPNADEGWYLNASKLVFQGRVPYRDFAFTQTPLLPYVYALTQQLGSPGLYAGRLTSLALFTAATMIAFTVVRRKAGVVGGLLVILSTVSNAWVGYFCSIVKTYALVSLLFVGTWALLASGDRSTRRLAFSCAIAMLAVAVRLSALAFALPIVVYAVAVANTRRARFYVLAATLVVGLGIAAFVVQTPDVARWHVVGHHLDQWGDLSLLRRVETVIKRRIPQFVIWFWPYLCLIGAVFLSGKGLRGPLPSKVIHSPQWSASAICAVGLSGFAAAHFVTGGWYMEYFVPVVVAGLPILVTGAYAARMWAGWGRRTVLAGLAVVGAGALQFAVHGRQNIDVSGGKLPVAEICELARLLAPRVQPGDPVVAMEALWVAVELEHPVVHGLEMGPFSLYEIDSEEALRLHVMNGTMIAGCIRAAVPGAVILTEWDWEMLARLGEEERVKAAIAQSYARVAHWADFGQRPGVVDAFVRRPERARSVCNAP